MIADDPGAGKTIMAGLIIKELKLRGLAKRILIISPGHLKEQWKRELKRNLVACQQAVDTELSHSQGVGQVGAQRKYGAMGEVDNAQDGKNKRIAQGKDGINTPDTDAV